jgi:ankyrin repeat protein
MYNLSFTTGIPVQYVGLDSACSPLQAASIYGQCDVVKCLLSCGAEINLFDEQGKSPLFDASLSGHHHILLPMMLQTMVILLVCYTN